MKRSGGTAGRPLGHLAITQLEALVSTSRDKPDELHLVLAELGHRKSKRATELRDLVTRLLDERQKVQKGKIGPLFD
jgi:ATP:corrinoid adenosyltransferase